MHGPQTVPFESWTENDAEKAVKVPTEYKVNRMFVSGDHWQQGLGWVGPRPLPGETGEQQALAQIAAAFTSRNVIGEVVERHARGVVGIEPIWGLAPIRPMEEDDEPTTEEQELIDEAEALLTAWWDRRGIGRYLQEWVATMLIASRGVLRLYVPSGLLTEADGEGGKKTTRVVAADDADALDHVFLGAPTPDTAGVYIDPNTQEPVCVFKSDVDGVKTTELVFREAHTGTGRVRENVVIRMLGTEENSRYVLPLGGRLTMFQGERPLMITTQVQQMQRALNLALSMLPRNVVTGGFLERVLLNAQMPGTYVEDENGGPPRFIPSPFITGPGVTNFVLGITDKDDDTGVEKTLTPDVRWRDPVDVKPAIEAKGSHYRDILEEVDQAHVLMNADAGASGRSREQARTDYVASLTRTQGEIEAGVRWLVETPLALVEAFTNQPGRWTSKLRAVASCQLDEGPLSPEERKQNVEEAKAGYLSMARAMARNGVTDPDAEMAAIAAQENRGLELREAQARVIEVLTKSGATLRQAALAVGMEPEIVDILAPEDQVPEDEDPEDPENQPTPDPFDANPDEETIDA